MKIAFIAIWRVIFIHFIYAFITFIFLNLNKFITMYIKHLLIHGTSIYEWNLDYSWCSNVSVSSLYCKQLPNLRQSRNQLFYGIRKESTAWRSLRETNSVLYNHSELFPRQGMNLGMTNEGHRKSSGKWLFFFRSFPANDRVLHLGHSWVILDSPNGQGLSIGLAKNFSELHFSLKFFSLSRSFPLFLSIRSILSDENFSLPISLSFTNIFSRRLLYV